MRTTKPLETLSDLESIWLALRTQNVEEWWSAAPLRHRVWLCGRYYPRAGFSALAEVMRYAKGNTGRQAIVESALTALASKTPVNYPDWQILANECLVHREYFVARCAVAIGYFERVKTFHGMYATIAHSQSFAAAELDDSGIDLPIAYLLAAQGAAPKPAVSP